MPTTELHSSCASSKPTPHAPGIRFEWINEQERKRDPASHLRKIVRSSAKRNYHLNLKAAKPKVKQLRRLEKASHPRVAVAQDQRSKPGPRVGSSGNPIVVSPSARSSSPESILGAGTIDPFDAFPVKMSPYMHKILHHYTSYCSNVFPKEEDGYTRLQKKWVPLCMMNVMAFKSLLLASETSLRGNSGLNPWSVLSINLMIEIVGLVRKEISSQTPDVSDTMFATVLQLGVIELVWGKRERYQEHMDGLRKMAEIRRGLENRELGSFLDGMINWHHQLGGEIAVPSTDEPDHVRHSQTKEVSVNDFPISRTSLPISNDLLELLKSMRTLTNAPKAVNVDPVDSVTSDYRATCESIQNQLQALQAKTNTVSNVEKLCNIAAYVYIDLILLHTPREICIASKESKELQQALTEANGSQERGGDNKDIFTWVFGTAAAVVAIGGQKYSEKVILADHLNEVLAGLEGLSIE